MSHRHDLLEILEDRDGTRSTVITSQLPRDRWHEYLGDPTVANAILDQQVHRAQAHALALALTGPSGGAMPDVRGATGGQEKGNVASNGPKSGAQPAQTG